MAGFLFVSSSLRGKAAVRQGHKARGLILTR